jgi:hypothetical protein
MYTIGCLLMAGCVGSAVSAFNIGKVAILNRTKSDTLVDLLVFWFVCALAAISGVCLLVFGIMSVVLLFFVEIFHALWHGFAHVLNFITFGLVDFR